MQTGESFRRFRVYYNDKEPYSGDPFLTPALGVQAIVRETDTSEKNFDVIRDSDFYCWQNGIWIGVDIFGLWDYLCGLGPKKVIFGRNLPHDTEYWAIIKRASTEGLG